MYISQIAWDPEPNQDVSRQCSQIRRQYRIRNKAAIVLQCESNIKLIAALQGCH